MKKFADKKRSERKFQVGDWVYLKLQPYRQLSVQKRENQKLAPKFYGPFEVTAKIGEVAYELRLPQGTTVHPVFHVSQLKARIGNGQVVTPGVPLEHPKQHSMEIPEGILGRRIVKRKNEPVNQILIKWKGQDDEEASWEDYESIKIKFPEFILRDKDNFERLAMSGNNLMRLGAVSGIDQVKYPEEALGEIGQTGQGTVNGNEALKSGTRDTGRDVKETEVDVFLRLQVGPKGRSVKETNEVNEALSDRKDERIVAATEEN